MSPRERDQADDHENADRAREHERCEKDHPQDDEPSEQNEGAHGSTPFPECFQKGSSLGRSTRRRAGRPLPSRDSGPS